MLGEDEDKISEIEGIDDMMSESDRKALFNGVLDKIKTGKIRDDDEITLCSELNKVIGKLGCYQLYVSTDNIESVDNDELLIIPMTILTDFCDK